MAMSKEQIVEALSRVRALITDVDGVLTDGRIGFTAGGDEVRFFTMRDGLGIRMLQERDIAVGWLSAGVDTGLIRRRADMLDVTHVDVGKGDKGPRFLALCEQMGVEPARTLYIGDDLNDLPAMERAGLAACPSDAAGGVREKVDFILATPGGHGCVREAIEMIVAAQS